MKFVNGLNVVMGTIKEENGKYVVYNKNGRVYRKFDNMFFTRNFLRSLGYEIVGE